MEDVLDLYEQPPDPKRPKVCMDERPCQLIDDVLVPRPFEPGQPQREDYEYQRHGTCCVFIAFEPDRGRRILQVRARRTKIDYALFMKELAEGHYPDAQCLRVVQDNLNTHTPASFYEALPPDEAFRLAQRFEFHATPKKGSWLNMAEIELAALSKQCLDRRIGDAHTLAQEATAWTQERNRQRITVQWKFSKSEARRKFAQKYPDLTKINSTEH